MQYITSVQDLDAMCKTIAIELDLPEGFFIMDYGTSKNSKDVYYRIKGNTARLKELKINQADDELQEKIRGRTFVNSPYRLKTRGIRFKKKFYGPEYLAALSNITEYSEEYGVAFGLDCPYSKLYWIIYRLMYEFSETSGIDPFDCCSRYLECSTTFRCTQPIREDRFDCGYRRTLYKGQIYYGGNRNIK